MRGKIKNRVTGATLSGELDAKYLRVLYMYFKIDGTTREANFRSDEWEFIPQMPDHPIGTIAKTEAGRYYIKMTAGWCGLAIDGGYSVAHNKQVLEKYETGCVEFIFVPGTAK